MSIKTFPDGRPTAFLIFLVLSALIHLGVWGLLSVLPSGQSVRKGARPPIVVDVVDLPPMEPGALSPVKKPPTAFAQRDQSVVKETWPEPSPRLPASRPAPAPALPQAPVEKGVPGQKAQAPGQKAAGDAVQDAAPSGPSVSPGPLQVPGPVDEPVREEVRGGADAPAGKRAPAAQPRILAEPKRPSLFPTDERIAELSKRYEAEAPKGEVGKTLSLNTSELRYQRYLIDMKRKIELHWDYPALASRNGWQGSLKINFRINRDGSVSDISLERSSGYPMLDDAAITALRLASPFAPFPANFTIEDLSIKGQFIYHLMVLPEGRP